MNIQLVRLDRSFDGIFGALYCSPSLKLFTLEHAYPLAGAEEFEPKIPAGNYECVKGIHILPGAKDSFTTFEITGVPGHTGLLFHPGNYNKDSEGCVLLGQDITGANYHKSLTFSKMAFAAFMKWMEDSDHFTLTIVDKYI